MVFATHQGGAVFDNAAPPNYIFPMAIKLNTRQNVFVLAFARDQNGPRAAMEAYGYTKFATAVVASRNLMRKQSIRNAIKKIEDQQEKQLTDANYVLNNLVQMVELSVQDFTEIDEYGIARIDLSALTDAQWRAIASIKYFKDGSTEVKVYDKLKALEAIGRHISVNAFTEPPERAVQPGSPAQYENVTDNELEQRIAKYEMSGKAMH